MKTEQLNYFLAVAQSGRVVDAAEKLQVSQPTISIALKRLESELGVTLFTRSGRALELNQNGKLFYEKIAPILKGLDQAQAALTEYSSKMAHEIRIASPLLTNFPGLMELLTGQDPQIRFLHQTLQQKTIMGQLANGGVDFAVFAFSEYLPLAKGIRYQVLQNDRMVVLAGRLSPFYERESISPQELSEARFVTRHDASFNSIYDALELSANIVYETTSTVDALRMVASTDCITIYSEDAARRVMQTVGDLRSIALCSEPPITLPLCIFWNAQIAEKPYVRAARERIIAYFAERGEN